MDEQRTTVVVEEKQTTTVIGEAVEEIVEQTETVEYQDDQKVVDKWFNGAEHPIHYLCSILLIGLAVAYCLRDLIPPGLNIVDYLYR